MLPIVQKFIDAQKRTFQWDPAVTLFVAASAAVVTGVGIAHLIKHGHEAIAALSNPNSVDAINAFFQNQTTAVCLPALIFTLMPVAYYYFVMTQGAERPVANNRQSHPQNSQP